MGSGESRRRTRVSVEPSPQEKPSISIEKSDRNFNHHRASGSLLVTNDHRSNSSAVRTTKLINLIWLDSHSVLQDNVIDTTTTKKILSEALSNASLTCFSDQNSCIEFIKQNQDTTQLIFLIVSGRDSAKLFNSLTADLSRHIDSIFVFCLAKKHYESFLLFEKKLVGVYREHNELLEAIRKQAMSVTQRDLILKFYSDAGKTARITPNHAKGEFLWLRVLKDTILQMERNERATKSMLDRFRILYRRDMLELDKIDDFERNYRPEKAIEWYTRDSFLYRVVNKSLRTGQTNELLIFAPYIADLCCAIRKLQTKLDTTITFFRGCLLNTIALQEFQLNMGSLLCVNSFFSASRQRDVAKMFADCGIADGIKGIVSVLFEIEMQECTQSFFADITPFSTKKKLSCPLSDPAEVYLTQHM